MGAPWPYRATIGTTEPAATTTTFRPLTTFFAMSQPAAALTRVDLPAPVGPSRSTKCCPCADSAGLSPASMSAAHTSTAWASDRSKTSRPATTA